MTEQIRKIWTPSTGPTTIYQPAMAWHIILNHTPVERLCRIAVSNTIPAIDNRLFTNKTVITCTACAGEKAAAAPHYGSDDHNQPPGNTISAGFTGPIAPPSKVGYRYRLTNLDVGSKTVFTIRYRAKFKFPKTITQKIKLIQNLYGKYIKRLITDNAKKVLIRRLGQF